MSGYMQGIYFKDILVNFSDCFYGRQNEKYKKVYTGLIGVYMEGDMAA